MKTFSIIAGLALAPGVSAQTQSVRIQIHVGQADGILVRTPNTQWVLIDGTHANPPTLSLQILFSRQLLAYRVGNLRLVRDGVG